MTSVFIHVLYMYKYDTLLYQQVNTVMQYEIYNLQF